MANMLKTIVVICISEDTNVPINVTCDSCIFFPMVYLGYLGIGSTEESFFVYPKKHLYKNCSTIMV